MDDRVHLFGIRHHGPGSAASLVAALDALAPEAVLIEGPPEADALIPFAAAPGMRPPLALLAYAAGEPGRAVFFPLARFSPEWQAMRWALAHGRPVRFIDWPAAAALAWRDAAAAPVRQDPLDRLAEGSGHADGEALWNALVESRGAASGVFAAIEQVMSTLRADAPEDARDDRREAFMRLEIRRALREREGPIAAVVGAWHVPALRRRVPAAEDRATLRDLPKLKTEVTWVPWTETRLAAASGYGAGVASPGWYGHLWTLYEDDRSQPTPDLFAATWQAKVAMLLRAEGHPAATASVIEAARLAVALAAVRGHASPGLDEMRDATLAALCHGDEAPFRLIEARLVVGQEVGALDESVPQMPLAADLAAWQRRLRLKPEALEQDAALDLRSEAGLAKSVLLHRLDLLDVPWGRLTDAGAGRGTFREVWRLEWKPELSVRLAEALVHGVTIAAAAGGAALAKAGATADITALADLVRRCLLADLPDAADLCIARLQAAAVEVSDVGSLMRAVPPLVAILRYGTARKMPLEALTALARALAVEVNAGLRLAAVALDDEAADAMRRALGEFDAALTLLADETVTAEWQRQLRRLVDEPAAAPVVAGVALRRLYDRGAEPPADVAAAFSRALSSGSAPAAAGRWLEGFLGANAEVVLQDDVLFGVIDGWLLDQREEDFIESLPMLRRAFAAFGATERRRLLQRVGQGRPVAAQADTSDMPDRPGFEAALPLLLTILGIDRDR